MRYHPPSSSSRASAAPRLTHPPGLILTHQPDRSERSSPVLVIPSGAARRAAQSRDLLSVRSWPATSTVRYIPRLAALARDDNDSAALARDDRLRRSLGMTTLSLARDDKLARWARSGARTAGCSSQSPARTRTSPPPPSRTLRFAHARGRGVGNRNCWLATFRSEPGGSRTVQAETSTGTNNGRDQGNRTGQVSSRKAR